MSEQILYARTVGGAHVEVAQNLPDFSGLEAAVAQAIAAATDLVGAAMVADTLAAYPDPAFSDSFTALHGAQGGIALAGVRVRNAIWRFAEENTRPHVAPLARIARWAEAHDRNPYAVRAKIAAAGTTGRHAMPGVLDRGVAQLRAAVDSAVAGVLNAR